MSKADALIRGLRKAVADPETELLDANIVRLLLDRYDDPARCEHPEEAMRQAILHDPEEARVCTDCSSMVFADGHVEPIGITGARRTKR